VIFDTSSKSRAKHTEVSHMKRNTNKPTLLSVFQLLGGLEPMSKIVSLLMLGALCIVCSGCSAVLARGMSGPHPKPMYFRGVQADYDNIAQSSGSDFPYYILFPVGCTIDMPLSFCADILYFPYDIHTGNAYRAWKTSMSNTPPNKTDAGNGSYGIRRVIDASHSPSPDPRR
jgi:uncharacterized protein YceK